MFKYPVITHKYNRDQVIYSFGRWVGFIFHRDQYTLREKRKEIETFVTTVNFKKGTG